MIGGLNPPLWATVLLDAAAWGLISTVVGYLGHHWPVERLTTDGRFTRLRRFEYRGGWYERVLRIKCWKDHLPEAGALFAGGFAKRRLLRKDPTYLRRFAVETRRAELIHWTVLLAGPFFGLWNPPVLTVAMIAYAVIANLPCIAIQRYNRARLAALLGDNAAGSGRS